MLLYFYGEQIYFRAKSIESEFMQTAVQTFYLKGMHNSIENNGKQMPQQMPE